MKGSVVFTITQSMKKGLLRPFCVAYFLLLNLQSRILNKCTNAIKRKYLFFSRSQTPSITGDKKLHSEERGAAFWRPSYDIVIFFRITNTRDH